MDEPVASEELIKIVKIVHTHGGLVMSTIGTSQESSGAQTVHDIALQNKICRSEEHTSELQSR